MHGLLNDGLDKVLCRMRGSLLFATLNEVSIIFEKESFINVKKVLYLIQSLTNEKKVIKSLTAFQICIPGYYSKFNRFFILCLTNDFLRTIFFVRKQFFVRVYECS